MYWPDRERCNPPPRYALPTGVRLIPAEYTGRQCVDAFSPPYCVYKPKQAVNKIQRSAEDEEPREGKSLGKIFRRFAEKTAMQGPGYIRESKKWYAKAAWTILLLATMGWMAYHLIYLIAHYLEKPVQTTISLGFNNLHFPSVTVCNVNVVKISAVPSTSKELMALIAAGNPMPGGAGGPGGSGGPGGPGGAGGPGGPGDSGGPSGPGDPPGGGQPPPGRKKVATRIRSGHQIGIMLMDCSYNGHKCYSHDFTLINTAEYGNCFTLHSEKFIAKEAGPKSGLSLIFFTENDEYIDSISQGYGLRLHVHQPGSFPNPYDKGLSIPTSFHSNIGLRVRDIKRVTPPYRQCEDGIEFEKKNGLKYTRDFAEFASNIGGAIGLWIGLSVLAMFEVVQLMIELCAYGFYLLCGKKRKIKDQLPGGPPGPGGPSGPGGPPGSGQPPPGRKKEEFRYFGAT
ncbi:acid-sensing ion channel 4-A-like [Saccostrea echinata]|uniref:acid-sensing ion channel 4-A-like n=1 Tax=Saccostrea echinata TaxID=191078 RepID=UPI002A831C7B|nr:acid-sensing ion channel 4-A-like [Saccostrea echinata]